MHRIPAVLLALLPLLPAAALAGTGLRATVPLMDALAAARACALDADCPAAAMPEGVALDPWTGEPLLRISSKGAESAAPLPDWAAAHPQAEIQEKLVTSDEGGGYPLLRPAQAVDADVACPSGSWGRSARRSSSGSCTR